jgi:hypothetical protein
MTANMFAPLSPMMKNVYPTPSEKRKRFAKIREQVQGKR